MLRRCGLDQKQGTRKGRQDEIRPCHNVLEDLQQAPQDLVERLATGGGRSRPGANNVHRPRVQDALRKWATRRQRCTWRANWSARPSAFENVKAPRKNQIAIYQQDEHDASCASGTCG